MISFRLAQRARGVARWRPTRDLPDRDLAALGYELAGPAIHVEHLEHAERWELRRLLRAPAGALSRDQRARLAALLATCPRSRPPPIDLDPHLGPRRRAEGGTYLSREEGHRLALAAAHLLLPHLEAVGLGRPAILATGGKGVHLDLGDADGAVHLHLLEGVGELVQTAARAAGLPLISEYRATSAREVGTVYVDDTLYQHGPESRQCMWQLEGSARGKRRVEA